MATKPRRSLKMRITIGLSVLLALAAAGARADRRSFIRSYEYATQPKGNLELELWNDVDAPRTAFTDSLIVTRVELEYGLTDHWDLALYHVFEQAPGSAFHFDSWRLETRYRLAEKGVWPVDVMLYFELERPADFTQPFEVEQKLILERNLGNFAVVANLVAEQKLLHAGEGHLWEVDLGARYEVAPALRLGAELWTIHETLSGVTTRTYFAGPSISVASSRFWLQVGAGFGLESKTGTFVRSVLGMNL